MFINIQPNEVYPHYVQHYNIKEILTFDHGGCMLIMSDNSKIFSAYEAEKIIELVDWAEKEQVIIRDV